MTGDSKFVDVLGIVFADTTCKIQHGTFTLSGGTISNNTATGTGGGGVRVGGGTFTMDGATARIENNIASGTASSNGGGGVRHTGGTANIVEGTITGNTSNRSGGGIFSDRPANLYVGANAVITNNTPSNINAGALAQAFGIDAFEDYLYDYPAEDDSVPEVETWAVYQATATAELAFSAYAFEDYLYYFWYEYLAEGDIAPEVETWTTYTFAEPLSDEARAAENMHATFAATAGEILEETETKTYNAFNQLISFSNGETLATYTYRADGLRQSKVVDGVTTTHVWLMGHIVLERDGNGAVINRFDRSPHGQLIHSPQHGFYLFNARGDVVQRVDAQGNILHNYRYSAFGIELDYDSSNLNPFRFAGMYWDTHTQTYYTPNRHFSPRFGRWTQPDPYWGIHNFQNCNWSILQAGNLFVFCVNNPIFWHDPLGLSAKRRQDFIRGLEEGLRQYGQNLVHTVTNPVEAITSMVDWAVDDPISFYLETTILSPMNPVTGPLAMNYGMRRAYQAGGAHGLGVYMGQLIGQGATIAVGYGVGKAVGAVAKKGGTTVTSNAGRAIDITPAKNHSTTRSTSLQGRPNSSVDILNKRGEVVTRRWFDSKGNQIRDVDFTKHGNPVLHPEVPHTHGPRRP